MKPENLTVQARKVSYPCQEAQTAVKRHSDETRRQKPAILKTVRDSVCIQHSSVGLSTVPMDFRYLLSEETRKRLEEWTKVHRYDNPSERGEK